ncbi:MAG: extensin family protein [Paracoccaceae bacterium]
MRGLGLVLLLPLTANLAFADGLTTSPIPPPRPQISGEPVAHLTVRPKARPIGLSAAPVLAEIPMVLTAAPPSKVQRPAMIGAVCNNPKIKGLALKPITSRIKGCGIKAPVQVSSVAGVSLNPAALINCDEAQALASWVVKGAQPAFGNSIVRMNVADSYSCRPRNNVRGAKVSEHGAGNAIDISGFVTNTGKTYTVAANYNSMVKAAQKAGCGVFHTILGPGSDGYHENHLHFDVAPYRGHPYCH